MKLLLMRHGATAGNERHCYVGRRSDEPLSALGTGQCARAGISAWAGTVHASPLLRARQTAELCFPAARVAVVPGLEEYDFGDFEGRTADEMVADVAYRAWVDGGCMGRCPQGESRAEYIARSNAALAGVLREADDRGDELVVVVAHGGTIMAALSQWCAEVPGGGDRYYGWSVSCCEGYLVEVRLDGEAVALQEPRRFQRLPL